MAETIPLPPTVDLSPMDQLLSGFPRDPHELLPLLQKTQAIYGYLPKEALRTIAEHLRVPLARVYGVVTFYAQFYLEPRGRHCVRVCQGTACHVRGGKILLDAVSQRLGVSVGETTPDLRFTLETAACLGTCFSAPVMMIDNDYYGSVTARRVNSILKKYE